MVPIYAGMVLQYLNEFTKGGIAKKIRIIHISEGQTYAFYVELDGDTNMPKPITVSRLNMELEGGVLREVSEPFNCFINEKNIPDKYRKMRDEAWEVVNFLWMQGEREVLYKNHREEFIKQAAVKFKFSDIQIKRIMTRFWQGGMAKNSVLPRFSNCGGPGKCKLASDKKRGRPPKISFKGEYDEGINVDPNIREIIKVAIETHWKESPKPTLTGAFNYMKAGYFSNSFKENGKLVIRTWETGVITWNQFYYWAMKNPDFKARYIAEHGQNKFDLEERETLGNSTMEVTGPGRMYQIDASIADIYVVHPTDRSKIVGRPVIYIVIDVWSRLIVGVYVGFEGPSWIGAMMAIDNIVEDKVGFCHRYGIEINEGLWPAGFIPDIILADRGECESHKPENLINNVRVDIDNTTPYRGDLKGIVENRFKLINGTIKRMAPGAVLKEYRERCAKDPRLEAKLTLNEFVYMFLTLIIKHNNSVIADYPMEKYQIVDLVKPVPVELWKYGWTKRRPRVFDRDFLRCNLMPMESASISKAGIKFHGMFYSCQEALQNQWFLNRNKTSIEVVYDPRITSRIYIPRDKGRNLIVCNLLPKSFTYQDMNFDEVDYLEELKSDVVKDCNKNPHPFVDNAERNISEMIKNAEKETNKAIKGSGKSKAARIKEIAQNKDEVKNANRDKECFLIGEETEKLSGTKLAQVIQNKEKDYTEISNLNLLKKRRDEAFEKK